MTNFTVALDDKLTENTIELLESNLIYVDESIVSFKIYPKKIELFFNPDSTTINQADIEKKIIELIKKLKPQKEIQPNIIFSNKKVEVKFNFDAFKELEKRKEVKVLQDGIVALSGLPLYMMDVLDEYISMFAKEQHARKMLLPITVNLKDLLDSHYFDRTPQHANFLSTIEESARSITDFSKVFKNKKLIQRDLLKSPHSMCRSAVCLNLYPTMRDEVFKSQENRAFTSVGRVFRHEYKKVVGLERLYEFTCKEIIYLGNKDYVKTKLKECENWFIKFLSEFELNGIIKSATDPFFMENARALQFYQAAEDSKYEVRVLNPFSETDVSIGSLNYHGNHFSKSYNIKFDDNDYVMSGCVGFGYERTIFTIISQYGTSYKEWPLKLKEFFQIDQFNE
jgi:seryl-tRNA synthetase